MRRRRKLLKKLLGDSTLQITVNPYPKDTTNIYYQFNLNMLHVLIRQIKKGEWSYALRP